MYPHIGLKREKNDQNPFWKCDPILYEKLAKIVNNQLRNVKSIRELKILPEDTVFYEEPLSFNGMPGIGPNARELRLKHSCPYN